MVLDNCTEKLADYIGQTLTFDLVGGNATFDNGLKSITSIFNGNVVIPKINSGLKDDQSFIIISDYKANNYDAIRVATVPSGNIQKLVSLLEKNHHIF